MTDSPDFPDIRVELVKFTQHGKSYPIGSGRLTKKGTGYALEIYPGQKATGHFYLFPKTAPPVKPEVYLSAADEYDI